MRMNLRRPKKSFLWIRFRLKKSQEGKFPKACHFFDFKKFKKIKKNLILKNSRKLKFYQNSKKQKYFNEILFFVHTRCNKCHSSSTRQTDGTRERSPGSRLCIVNENFVRKFVVTELSSVNQKRSFVSSVNARFGARFRNEAQSCDIGPRVRSCKKKISRLGGWRGKNVFGLF